MSDYSLVPVDYQPEFEGVSLVPVDYHPFSADGATHQAQAQPESPPQSPAAGAGLPDAGAPALAIEGASDGSRPLLLASAGDNYPTADAAAIAALQDINPTSQRYGLEYAGRVYQKWLGLGNYSYTPPAEGEAFKSDPGSRLTPLLHSLGVNAGTYHTHVRGLDPELDEHYSSGDKNRSEGEGAPSYLGTPRGMIYKYSPIPNHPSQGDVSVTPTAPRNLLHSPTFPGGILVPSQGRQRASNLRMLSLENDGSWSRRAKFACGSILVLIAVFLITMWMTTPEIKTDPFLLSQENWPVTVEEVVHDILPRLTPYEKLNMMFMKKDQLNYMHFGLGLSIRNRYGLWRGNDKLILSACGFPCHPDDASGKIVEAVWQVLHK